MRLQSFTAFGELITADHTMENDESRSGHTNALIVHDDFTNWFRVIRIKPKKHRKQCRVYKGFFLPSLKPKTIYTDNSKEFIEA